jgi:hypothetical protein
MHTIMRKHAILSRTAVISSALSCLAAVLFAASSARAAETYYTAAVDGHTFSYRLDGANAVIERSGLVSDVITYFPAVSPAPSGAFAVPATLDGHPVTGLGPQSFVTNALLTAVTLPESLTEIGSSVFFQCSALQSVSIPDGVTGIGPNAFYGCSALTGTVTGTGVKSAGFAAFGNCRGIKEIRLPAVTNLGDRAFLYCTSLTNVVLGADLASLGDYVCGNCSRLVAFEIPAGVATISGAPFKNCSALKRITLAAGNSAFCVSNAVLYTADFSSIVLTVPQDTLPDPLVIPGTVTNIQDGAFSTRYDLHSVTIPDSVTVIPDNAFQNCSSLTNLVLGARTTTIRQYAFDNCGLLSVTIPASVTTLGDCAFRDLHLTRVTFLGNAPASVGRELYSSSSVVTNYVLQGSTGWSGTPGDATIPATWQSRPVVVVAGPDPLAVTTTSLPDATEMVAYRATLAATNGTPPYSWSLKTGYLEARATSTFATVGTAKGWQDDDGCWEAELPFAFPFYGQSYSKVYVGSNGTLSFGSEFNEYEAGMYAFTNGVPMIAALWDDLSTSSGNIYVDSSPDHVTIRWAGTYLNGGTAVSFAATLSPDGKIVLSYGDGNADGGFIGVSAGDGVSYLLSSAGQSGTMAQAQDVVFTPKALPVGFSFEGGVVSGMPTVAGSTFCDFIVKDANGQTAVKTLSLTVKANANTRPIIRSVSPADTEVVAPISKTQTFSVSAIDPEGAKLSYVWMYDGTAVKGATSASYSFAPAVTDRGAHTLSCNVSDGLWTIGSQIWTVSVKAVYYVNGAAGLDSNTGIDWAHAKKTIQAAVSLTEDNDSVIVTNGVYAPVTPTPGRVLTIESVNGADFTIIDGGNANRCLTACDSTDTIWQDVVLRGFTLRNGNADKASSFTFYGGGAVGGTLYDCVLMNNYAGQGGGGAYATRLVRCVVRRNRTNVESASSHGGGILNCFAERTRIEGNTSTENAGVSGGQSLNCIIWNNSAKASGGVGYGANLVNCTIVGNAAVTNAGIGGCSVCNCIIWGNTNSSGRVLNYTPRYSVISTNGSSVVTNWFGVSPDHCCTVPVYNSSCISGDPMFVDAAAGDFRLLQGSPCVSRGNPYYLWNYDYFTGNEVYMTTDFGGNPRMTDNNVTIGAYESYAHHTATPVILPVNGTVFAAAFCKVSISCESTNAVIYYTTNGVDPTIGHAVLYTGPFNIRGTTIVKAVAASATLLASDTAVAAIIRQTVSEAYGDLAAALDVPAWIFSASAVDAWAPFADSTAKTGTSSARSASVADSGTAWMQSVVYGSGTLSFWWRASCEDDPDGTSWDHLEFTADGTVKASLDGQTGWVKVTLTFAGTGSHFLRWAYVKDGSGSAGEDCGWVDSVTWLSTSGNKTTSTTEDPVPYAWLDGFGLAASGDYEAAAKAIGANGVPVWQSYVAGLDPTAPASQLLAEISFINGKPHISWTPDLSADGRIYSVLGKPSPTYTGSWAATNSASRYFKVKVQLPK